MRPPAPSGRGRMSTVDKIAVSRALSEGARHIRAVKGCYIACAVLVGLALIPAVLSAPTSTPTLVLGASFVIALAGALFVERAPVLFTLVAAIGGTLVAAAAVLVFVTSDASTPGVLSAFPILLAVAFWVAHGFARRYAAVLRRNSRHLTVKRTGGGRVEVSVEGVGTRHRDRARREELAHRRRRRLLVAGVVAAFAGVIAIAIRIGPEKPAEPPPPPAPAVSVDAYLASFRSDWTANRVEAVKSAFLQGVTGTGK